MAVPRVFYEPGTPDFPSERTNEGKQDTVLSFLSKFSSLRHGMLNSSRSLGGLNKLKEGAARKVVLVPGCCRMKMDRHRSKGSKEASLIHHSKGRKIIVEGSGMPEVNQVFKEQSGNAVPPSVRKYCFDVGRNPDKGWKKLSDLSKPWFEASNGAYIYWNSSAKQWWIETSAGPVYWSTATGPKIPPNRQWEAMNRHQYPAPQIRVLLEEWEEEMLQMSQPA